MLFRSVSQSRYWGYFYWREGTWGVVVKVPRFHGWCLSVRKKESGCCLGSPPCWFRPPLALAAGVSAPGRLRLARCCWLFSVCAAWSLLCSLLSLFVLFCPFTLSVLSLFAALPLGLLLVGIFAVFGSRVVCVFGVVLSLSLRFLCGKPGLLLFVVTKISAWRVRPLESDLALSWSLLCLMLSCSLSLVQSLLVAQRLV